MKSPRPPRWRQFRFGPAALCLLLLSASVRTSAVAAPAEPDKDPQLVGALREARQLLDTKQPAAAIAKCEAVIAAFQAGYGKRKERVLCARRSEESLFYLLEAARDNRPTIVLSSTWADAWFLKGYALLELGRRAEAKGALEHALALSPKCPLYLCELGTVYQMEKNWPKALKQFELAEENALLAPEASKAAELAQARRGAGYTLAELGRLEEAAKKYEQCLAADPNDANARRELSYVRAQQAKGKPL